MKINILPKILSIIILITYSGLVAHSQSVVEPSIGSAQNPLEVYHPEVDNVLDTLVSPFVDIYGDISDYVEQPYISGEAIYRYAGFTIKAIHRLNVLSALTDPVACYFCELAFSSIDTEAGFQVIRWSFIYSLYIPCSIFKVFPPTVCWHTVDYVKDIVAKSLLHGWLGHQRNCTETL